MSKGSEGTGFWAGGQRKHLSALAEEMRDELRRLEEELSRTTEPARRAELKESISVVLADHERAELRELAKSARAHVSGR